MMESKSDGSVLIGRLNRSTMQIDYRMILWLFWFPNSIRDLMIWT